jgi:hypothetical protein
LSIEFTKSCLLLLPCLEQDVENFTQELMALRRAANERMNLDDFKHLKKIERWGKLCSAAGYGTAWIMPNPVSAFLMSQGNVTRWTTIAHHVVHKGYDKIEGVPERYTSTGFAKGLRRFLDWNDWILPQAWANEHNKLHHYNLGEAADPDQVELNLEWLRDSKPTHACALRHCGLVCHVMETCILRAKYP